MTKGKLMNDNNSTINTTIAHWIEEIDLIPWYKKPKSILSTKDGWHDWFVDGELNTSYLALDYHIEQGGRI